MKKIYDREQTFAIWSKNIEENFKKLLGNALFLKVDNNLEKTFVLLTGGYSKNTRDLIIESRSSRFSKTELRQIISYEEGALGEAKFIFSTMDSDSNTDRIVKEIVHECWNYDSPYTLGDLIKELISHEDLPKDWESFLHPPTDEEISSESNSVHEVICHGITLTFDVTLPLLQSCFFSGDLSIRLIIK